TGSDPHAIGEADRDLVFGDADQAVGAPPGDDPASADAPVDAEVDPPVDAPGAVGRPLAALPALAHELRGPIHALVTTAEILVNDMDTLDGEQIRRMAMTMHQQSLWLHGLVENLLAAATISEGQFHVQP